MEESQFEYIVEALTPIILKEDTYKRECIKPYEMVSLALRYLASGKTLRSLEFQLRIGKKTISQIVTDVTGKFYQRWDFPNGSGAIDGNIL